MMKQPGPWPGWLAFWFTASIRAAGVSLADVRTWAMRDELALIAAVDQAAEMATATVCIRESGPAAYSRLADDLLWVAANCCGAGVDLGVSDRYTGQLDHRACRRPPAASCGVPAARGLGMTPGVMRPGEFCALAGLNHVAEG